MRETAVFSVRQYFLDTFGRKSRQGVREVLIYHFRPLVSTEPRKLLCSKGARVGKADSVPGGSTSRDTRLDMYICVERLSEVAGRGGGRMLLEV